MKYQEARTIKKPEICYKNQVLSFNFSSAEDAEAIIEHYINKSKDPTSMLARQGNKITVKHSTSTSDTGTFPGGDQELAVGCFSTEARDLFEKDFGLAGYVRHYINPLVCYFVGNRHPIINYNDGDKSFQPEGEIELSGDFAD